MRIFQKDAYISVDFANHDITVIGQSDDASNPLIPGMDIKQLSFSKADALEQELSAFIAAVSSRQAPQVSGRAGRKALMIALEIMEQYQITVLPVTNAQAELLGVIHLHDLLGKGRIRFTM